MLYVLKYKNHVFSISIPKQKKKKKKKNCNLIFIINNTSGLGMNYTL